MRAGILRRRRGGLRLEVTVTGCSRFSCLPVVPAKVDSPCLRVRPSQTARFSRRSGLADEGARADRQRTSRVDRHMAHALASARALRLCARPIVPKRARTRRFAVRAGRHPATPLFLNPRRFRGGRVQNIGARSAHK